MSAIMAAALPTDDEEFVPIEPPAPRRPVIAAELAAAQNQIKDLEGQIAELALAQAEGKPVTGGELRALYERRQEAQFAVELKTLADSFAEEVDRQALQGWKDDVLSLEPEDIADGISTTECPDFCHGGCGCALTGFRPQCLHPATFTRFPNELEAQGVSSAAWRAADQIIRGNGDDK